MENERKRTKNKGIDVRAGQRRGAFYSCVYSPVVCSFPPRPFLPRPVVRLPLLTTQPHSSFFFSLSLSLWSTLFYQGSLLVFSLYLFSSFATAWAFVFRHGCATLCVSCYVVLFVFHILFLLFVFFSGGRARKNKKKNREGPSMR